MLFDAIRPVGLAGFEPATPCPPVRCADQAAPQSEVLRLPPENRVHFPFPRNRVPLSRVCDTDSAMAGREPLPSSDRPDSNRRPPGPEPGALAYCATIRSRRGGWFGIHPAGARFRSCRAATLPAAEGRTYAKPPSAPHRGHPESHGTLRRFGSGCGALCGPDGGRTRCLRVANATLYRLSYKPVSTP